MGAECARWLARESIRTVNTTVEDESMRVWPESAVVINVTHEYREADALEFFFFFLFSFFFKRISPRKEG